MKTSLRSTSKALLFPILATAAFVASVSYVTAQNKPVWETEVSAGIMWQKVTSLGNVIVSTGTSLQGIDPASGKVNWTLNQVQYTIEDNFENISGTPFFSVTDNKGVLYIIEPFEGKILFSSTQAGLEKISSKYFLYKNSAILMLGYAPGQKAPSMIMVDMNTGSKIWSKDGEFSKIVSCIDLGNDEFIVSTLFYVYKMGVKSGDVKWKKCIDAKLEKMSALLALMDKGAGNSSFANKEINSALLTSEYANDIVFMAAQQENQKTSTGADGKKVTTVEYSTIYNAFKISTGDYAWPAIVEIKGKLGLLIPDKKGLIVTHGTFNMNNSAVNMINYTSGQFMWGKKGNGLSVKGSPGGSAEVSGKIIISSRNDNNSFLYSLNPSTGMMDFEKPAKISGVIEYLETVGSNLLVATEEEVDLYNASTGEFSFDKPLRGNRNTIISGQDKVYIFNSKDDMLYSLDKSATVAKGITKVPVKFQGKESVNKMEIREKGVLLSSDQNIALVDFSGALVFNKYYPAPDQPGWKKALLIANAIYGAYATAVYGYSSAVYGAVSSSIVVKNTETKVVKDVTATLSSAYGNAAASGMSFTKKCVETAGKRFKASSQSNNSMFMMVELGKRQYGLVQISKETGEKLAVIDMAKDKTPSYDLDIVENAVYYKSGDKKLQAFQFK